VRDATEYIEFRRAFVWLLCGMLLPSVALVAFGVVAVANERAAVERRLSDEYQARLKAIEHDLSFRLEQAAAAVADRAARGQPAADPLLASLTRVEDMQALDPSVAEAARRAATLPLGGHLFVSSDTGGERRAWLLTRISGPAGGRTLVAQLDLEKLSPELRRLARERFPHDRASFRLLSPREQPPGLSALKRIVAEVAPSTNPASIVARLPLGPPLEGFSLAAEISGDDPAAALAFRNRTFYIGMLFLLYSGIGVGFGLTIREMRRAFKLSRLKTDFVANISHELRTPLTSVRLFAETLKEGRISDPNEVQECLDMLSKESERLSNLVEKLLDWSRLESGRKALERESTGVPALLAQVGEAFRAQQLKVSYSTVVEPDLPEVDVDRAAIAQAVLNLLHNAVKYTGDDKRIQLSARKEGAEVAIEVQDNGPGVRPQDRKRIFERFYRGEDLLSRATEGTGLGLAISKRIVEAHGGRIELESRLGHGSTFRILIPPSAG
jgi:signal transduction histidine kinase